LIFTIFVVLSLTKHNVQKKLKVAHFEQMKDERCRSFRLVAKGIVYLRNICVQFCPLFGSFSVCVWEQDWKEE